MSPIANEYDYLWNGTQSGWVLVRCYADDQEAEYMVYNELKGKMLLIEDTEALRLVCERLKSSGVTVLEEIPKKEFDISNLDIEE